MRAYDTPTAQPAVSGLGPRPTGDPDGMEALADELTGFARALGGIPRIELDNCSSAGARRATAVIEAALRASRDGATRLVGVASDLRSAACRVRAEQQAWDRQSAQLLDEARGGRP